MDLNVAYTNFSQDFSNPNIAIRQIKAFRLFCSGLIIYSAAYCYTTVAFGNYVLALPIQSFGVFLIVAGAVKLIQFRLKNGYLKWLMFFYFLWVLITIARGDTFNFQFIKDQLFDAEYGVLAYLVPLIILFPINVIFLKKLFTVISALALIFISYDILFVNNLLDVSNYFVDVSSPKYAYDHFTTSLSLPVGFILLTYSYNSRMAKRLAFLVVAVTVLFAIIRARRGLLFLTVCPVVFASMLYFVFEKKNLIIMVLFITIGSLLLFNGLRNYVANGNGVFKLLSERIDEDSRTPVEDCFYQDMTIKDWTIGKGINGQYYCPNVDENDLSGYREVIETNYLHIILKGGLIMLVLLLLVAVPALIKGIFYSKNLLSKAAGIWIMLWLVDLYPATVFAFSLNYLLVWISIGICYNEELRGIPQSVLKNYFTNSCSTLPKVFATKRFS